MQITQSVYPVPGAKPERAHPVRVVFVCLGLQTWWLPAVLNFPMNPRNMRRCQR